MNCCRDGGLSLDQRADCLNALLMLESLAFIEVKSS